MSNRTIKVYNQTGNQLDLPRLAAHIPPAGYLELSIFAETYQILDSEDLYVLVATSQALLEIDGRLLNQQESAAALRPPVIGEIAHGSLSGKTATDHHDNSNDPSTAQKAALDNAVGGAISGSNPVVTKAYADSIEAGTGWVDPVKSRQTTPPGSPATGDRYLIDGTGTGAWAGHNGEIARWDGSAWAFTTPIDGTTTTVQDEDVPYRQTAEATPWVWIQAGGATSIHGNEKHNPATLTAGGNRSDANLDTLTGGDLSEADSLHTHAAIGLERATFRDEFFGDTYDTRTWRATTSGGGSSVSAGKSEPGGQLCMVSGPRNRRYAEVSWNSFGLNQADTILKTRVRRPDQANSLTEVGLFAEAKGAVVFRGETGNWIAVTDDGHETTTDTGVLADGTFRRLEIRVTPSQVTFWVDGVLKATHTTNIPPGSLMPWIHQETIDGSSSRISWIDFVDTSCVRG